MEISRENGRANLMQGVIVTLVVLAVLGIARKPLTRILMLLFVRMGFRAGLADVGSRAVAKQPDLIHLAPRPGHPWTNSAAVEALAVPLPSLGFSEAGTYGIQEMAGLFLKLLVQPDQRIAACIYEHPKVGTWIDLFSHYKDGTGLTYTTARPTGLDQRRGARTVHAPGTGTEALYQQMLRERPAGDLEEMTPANVVGRFEGAYLRAAAWRKNKGVAAEEVARHIQQAPFKAQY